MSASRMRLAIAVAFALVAMVACAEPCEPYQKSIENVCVGPSSATTPNGYIFLDPEAGRAVLQSATCWESTETTTYTLAVPGDAVSYSLSAYRGNVFWPYADDNADADDVVVQVWEDGVIYHGDFTPGKPTGTYTAKGNGIWSLMYVNWGAKPAVIQPSLEEELFCAQDPEDLVNSLIPFNVTHGEGDTYSCAMLLPNKAKCSLGQKWVDGFCFNPTRFPLTTGPEGEPLLHVNEIDTGVVEARTDVLATMDALPPLFEVYYALEDYRGPFFTLCFNQTLMGTDPNLIIQVWEDEVIFHDEFNASMALCGEWQKTYVAKGEGKFAASAANFNLAAAVPLNPTPFIGRLTCAREIGGVPEPFVPRGESTVKWCSVKPGECNGEPGQKSNGTYCLNAIRIYPNFDLIADEPKDGHAQQKVAPPENDAFTLPWQHGLYLNNSKYLGSWYEPCIEGMDGIPAASGLTVQIWEDHTIFHTEVPIEEFGCGETTPTYKAKGKGLWGMLIMNWGENAEVTFGPSDFKSSVMCADSAGAYSNWKKFDCKDVCICDYLTGDTGHKDRPQLTAGHCDPPQRYDATVAACRQPKWFSYLNPREGSMFKYVPDILTEGMIGVEASARYLVDPYTGIYFNFSLVRSSTFQMALEGTTDEALWVQVWEDNKIFHGELKFETTVKPDGRTLKERMGSKMDEMPTYTAKGSGVWSLVVVNDWTFPVSFDAHTIFYFSCSNAFKDFSADVPACPELDPELPMCSDYDLKATEQFKDPLEKSCRAPVWYFAYNFIQEEGENPASAKGTPIVPDTLVRSFTGWSFSFSDYRTPKFDVSALMAAGMNDDGRQEITIQIWEDDRIFHGDVTPESVGENGGIYTSKGLGKWGYVLVNWNEEMSATIKTSGEAFVRCLEGDMITHETFPYTCVAIPPPPVEPPVEAPVEAPVESPVEAPVEPPIEAPVEAPEEPPQTAPTTPPVAPPATVVLPDIELDDIFADNGVRPGGSGGNGFASIELVPLPITDAQKADYAKGDNVNKWFFAVRLPSVMTAPTADVVLTLTCANPRLIITPSVIRWVAGSNTTATQGITARLIGTSGKKVTTLVFQNIATMVANFQSDDKRYERITNVNLAVENVVAAPPSQPAAPRVFEPPATPNPPPQQKKKDHKGRNIGLGVGIGVGGGLLLLGICAALLIVLLRKRKNDSQMRDPESGVYPVVVQDMYGGPNMWTIPTAAVSPAKGYVPPNTPHIYVY